MVPGQQINVALLSYGTSCRSSTTSRNCERAIDGVTDQYRPVYLWELMQSKEQPWIQVVFHDAFEVVAITFHHTYLDSERNCKTMKLSYSDGSEQTVSILPNELSEEILKQLTIALQALKSVCIEIFW